VAERQAILTLGVDLAAADERTALAVVEWRDGGAEIQEAQLGVDDDAMVRAETGLIPLSVSADRIAHAAFRAALLLTRLAESGTPVDRTGEGPVAEIYPAACLRRWGLTHRGYKRGDGHGFLVDHLLAAAPWLKAGEHEGCCGRVMTPSTR
jgi:hypothetical protein